MKLNTEPLAIWFEEEKRDFPWRENPTPYRVWVSEVMLQQTRASVVIPYFERWMARFPTIKDLADASEEEVMKLWEGLGYYSRARALLQGARFLLQVHRGSLPDTREELEKVKGIGPYTAGAILSFAFKKKEAAVDGNVLRVLSRLFAMEQEIDQLSTQKEIREKVEQLLPDSKPWVIMEALIELGAKICVRTPLCGSCPMQESCLGFLQGKAEELPKRQKRQPPILLERVVPVIFEGDFFLVQKQKGGKVMAGLYEFPYFERGASWKLFYPSPLKKERELSKVTHGFTRYKATLFPSLWRAEKRHEIEGFSWIKREELSSFPFSSGHRRILTQLLEEYAHFTH